MKIPLPERLLEYLDFSYPTDSVLLIESEHYIAELLRLFPKADVYFVSSDEYKIEDVKEEFASRIKYINLAFNQEPLTFESEFFDVILGDELLAENFNPQDIASGLGRFLKPTGYFLTSFSNLLYKPWIEKLIKEGRSEFIVRRGYTKEDFERLMIASFYKEVYFAPLYETGEDEKICRNLEENEDYKRPEPPFYLARAYRSVFQIRALKAEFSKEIRAELGRLLRRIEFETDTDSSLQRLREMKERYNIFEDYLADFAAQACFDAEKVTAKLRENGIIALLR